MQNFDKKYLKEFLPCSIDQAWTFSLLLIDELRRLKDGRNIQINFHPGNIEYFNENDSLALRLPDSSEFDNLPFTYISPEETGRVLETPDYRSNFYRLGIICYELFNGHPPFKHDDRLKVYWQHIAQSPSFTNGDEKLIFVKSIILKLLQKSKENRYQSVEGMAYDWQQAYAHSCGKEITENFELGTKDLSIIFNLPKNFIGRKNEVNKISKIIEQVSTTNGKGLVIISGQKFIGKSFLLNHLVENIKSKNYILFESDGKLDNISPYNLFVQGFNKYLRYLQLTNGQNIGIISQNIINRLGSNTDVFTALVPDWESVLGTHKSPVPLGQRETVLRLSFVLSNVLSVLSNNEVPIVFAVNNLELASKQSLSLLSLLLSEGDIKKFVFLATVQNKDEDATNIDTFQKLRSSAISLQSELINLSGFSDDEIGELLINAKLNQESAHAIKKYIGQTTGGNPYLIKELLDKAFTSNYFTPNVDKNCWDIDVDKVKTIQLSIDTTSFDQKVVDELNLVELEIAQICACVGMSFELDLINKVVTNNRENLPEILASLHSKDLIIPYNNEGQFIFINDNVRAIILNTFDHALLLDCTKKILICLGESAEYRSSSQSIYKFLRYVLSLPSNEVSDYKEHLMLGAAEAKKIGGLQEAVIYYNKILDAGLYQSEDEKFVLQISLLEMYVGLLDFHSYNKLRDAMLQRKRYNEIHIASLDAVHCRALSGQQRFPETVQHALDSLRKLGINIVKKPSFLRTIYSVVTAGMAIKSKSMEELEFLPETQDLRSLHVLNIIRETSSSFFLSSPETLPEVLSLQIKMAINKGINNTIGLVFSTYGFTVSSFNKDFRKSEEMMELAYKLDERFQDKTSHSVSQFLHYGLTSHWVRPNRVNAAKLMGNYIYSLEAGQQGMAYYSMGLADILYLFSGQPLSKLQPTLIEHRRICQDKRQFMIIDFQNIQLQFIENITSHSDTSIIMEGTYFSMVKSKLQLENKSQNTTLSVMYAAEGLQKLLYQNYENSLPQLVFLNNQLSKTGLSSFSTIMGYYFHILSIIQDRSIPLRTSNKYIGKVKEWAGYAEINFGGWYSLCLAAQYKMAQDRPLFFYHIEAAILWFENQNILYGEAYAKLLKVEFIEDNLKISPSINTVTEIINLYEKWGANHICERLQTKYNLSVSNLSKRSNQTNDIDLSSLLSASTSIASEIKLDNLLEKLTSILIQNAGAQKVIIFQFVSGTLCEVAHKLGNQPVSLFQHSLNATDHPLNLISIAKNNMRPEIIETIDDYVFDKYLQKQRPLSAMILPVIKNKETIAIIYLENSLSKGVFTPERVELVSLLSGQVAISMENALLYNDMEQRVVSRTNELSLKNEFIEANNKKLSETLTQLQSAQNQLIQSEKLASLGELTAGIAHEIQNPLNFVNNFSEVSTELIEEMKEELSMGNKQWSKGNLTEANVKMQNCIEIANDLTENLTKINQHGQRASSIVRSMLEHSRKSSGEKTSTDINALCNEYLRLSYHGLRAKDKSFNADFELIADPNLPKVNVIPQDISRVLLNLINNAFWAVNDKQMKLGDSDYKPKVSVFTRIEKSPSGDLGVGEGAEENVLISVQDNGNGIPQENIDKIFQPFFTTKPTGQGTGLGLSLSYDIVKAHGGDLKVESNESQGTILTIQLPIS